MSEFEVSEARKTSGMNKKVIYQMFLRCFTREGTINAATEKLEHVASLGVDIIYLVSFCQADDDNRKEYWSPRQIKSGIDNPRNPYRISNYDKIDPEYGNEEDFKKFVDRAHELGLLVMNDLVYLHCGPGEFPEKYPTYVKRDSDGRVLYNSYHFPLINFDNPELREYLWNNMLYWVRKFDIDGYRCDVGDEVPLDFWREGRRRIEQIKPNFLMLNEGERADYLLDVFDANYDFFGGNAICKTVSGECTVNELRCCTEGVVAKHPDGGLVLRAYDNHDYTNDAYENRLEKIAPDNIEAILVFNFTVNGVPFLYNGNEFADTTRHSLWSLKDDQLRIDWSNLESDKGKHRMCLIRKLCKLRHDEKSLCQGKTVWKKHLNLAIFSREIEGEKIMVLINFEKNEISVPQPTGNILLKNKINTSNNTLSIYPGGYCVIKQPQ